MRSRAFSPACGAVPIRAARWRSSRTASPPPNMRPPWATTLAGAARVTRGRRELRRRNVAAEHHEEARPRDLAGRAGAESECQEGEAPRQEHRASPDEGPKARDQGCARPPSEALVPVHRRPRERDRRGERARRSWGLSRAAPCLHKHLVLTNAEHPFWYSSARSSERVPEVGILERGRHEAESLAPILTLAQTHPRTVVTTLRGAGSGLPVGAAGPATWRSDAQTARLPVQQLPQSREGRLVREGP